MDLLQYSAILVQKGRLSTELRERKQHCQKNTPEYLSRNMEILKKLYMEHSILFRLDSSNNAASTIKVLADSGHFFLIKRNIRKESRESWLDTAKAEGEVIELSHAHGTSEQFHSELKSDMGIERLPSGKL